MRSIAGEQELLAKASSGDAVALQQLLFDYYDPLREQIASKIPPSVQAVVDADDVVQETFAEVIRELGQFSPRTSQSFCAWLKRIAENRVQAAVRHRMAKKRGGDRKQVHGVIPPGADSMVDLIEVLSAGSHTPSRSAARHEAAAAVQQVIDDLPADYRQAVQLRLLEGRSLTETSGIMNRSPRAVQGLVDRAKKKMRAALGRLSLYE